MATLCDQTEQTESRGVLLENQIHFHNHLGERLAGTLHEPENANGRGIVMGHCFTCSRHTTILRELGRDLAESGYFALRFDFSGNGQSEGDFSASTYSKQISEMHAAAGVIAQRGVSWIGMAGHSMGAVIAVLTAGEFPEFRAVCAMAGRLSGMDAKRFLNAAQLRELHKTGRVTFSSRGRNLELIDRFFSDASSFALPEILKDLRTPLLVIHGDADEIVPVSEATGAEALNPGTIRSVVIPRADHMFSNAGHRRLICRRVVDWLQEIDS